MLSHCRINSTIGAGMAAALLTLSSPALAAPTVSAEQLERIRFAKQLLGEVEPRSVGEIARELASQPYPEGNLQILEAVAQTYRDMLLEYEEARPRKEWLHSMILLNMAYFQFGGRSETNDTGLNIIIRRKLKKYLPPELLSDAKLFYSLE